MSSKGRTWQVSRGPNTLTTQVSTTAVWQKKLKEQPLFCRPISIQMKTRILLILTGISLARMVQAQTLLNAGFEDNPVAAGGFLKPTTGPWTFSNDAGIVRPFAPNSSTGPLNTWSATFVPIEGQQYASTYAASDLIRQGVVFGAAGNYRISVYAAAPDGTLTIPNVGTSTLTDGEFSFVLGNLAIGQTITVPKGSSWNVYNADFTIPSAGTYDVGVRNTKAAAYFINYDAFSIQSVPEPSLLALLLPIGLMVARRNASLLNKS